MDTKGKSVIDISLLLSLISILILVLVVVVVVLSSHHHYPFIIIFFLLYSLLGKTVAYKNKTLGRAQDPRANGTWQSKLTE